MEVYWKSSWLFLLLGLLCLAATLQGVQGGAESEGPSESECRPYIEKALKELETADATDPEAPGDTDGDSKEDLPTVEITTDDSAHEEGDGDNDDDVEDTESTESADTEQEGAGDSKEKDDDDEQSAEQADEAKSSEDEDAQSEEDDKSDEDKTGSQEEEQKSAEDKSGEDKSEEVENQETSTEDAEYIEGKTESSETEKSAEDVTESTEEGTTSAENSQDEEETKSAEITRRSAENTKSGEEKESAEEAEEQGTADEKDSAEDKESGEEGHSAEDTGSAEDAKDNDDSKHDAEESKEDESLEEAVGDSSREEDKGSKEDVSENKEDDGDSKEGDGSSKEDGGADEEIVKESVENEKDSGEDTKEDTTDSKEVDSKEATVDETGGKQNEEGGNIEENNDEKESKEETESTGNIDSNTEGKEYESKENKDDSKEEGSEEDSDDSAPEEDLTNEDEVPEDLRSTDHIAQLLKLDDENEETEKIIDRVAEIILRDLKRLYDNAIKPLEVLYKYRDLSNRHFGDPEIFSKPLILFMGPWSGGKSSIINYLVENEYNETSLKTGAEPSPAYFNILMHGDEPEVLDGTQLAADYTFSGLQKFGQGLEERLRGLKLPKKLLEKINIVEIPGILEVRKQVSRVFPFNDACQWFIDRADIIFLVYDPSKLDVGPETEAILDQLKGREHQTRIILNKADQVKPEELMRVQGALIWNISPLMSSAQPPIMYTTSLWSRPYEPWAPVRLLHAQERAFLRDLRSAVDKRIENKISSARRFAVRVRNHAKMVDCYLTTYYNHKSVFGNRKQVSDAIIEHPQDYHIYEGLSTLTNISRYDLPDPDVYRDFFRLNALYDFQQLSATCTYFRGCPINRLDVAIAYDLPELVGKYRRTVESALNEASQAQPPSS